MNKRIHKYFLSNLYHALHKDFIKSLQSGIIPKSFQTFTCNSLYNKRVRFLRFQVTA